MAISDKRSKLIDYMSESEDNLMEVYTYLNGNLCQCFSYQAEYIISSSDELDDRQVDELYEYIFG